MDQKFAKHTGSTLPGARNCEIMKSKLPKMKHRRGGVTPPLLPAIFWRAWYLLSGTFCLRRSQIPTIHENRPSRYGGDFQKARMSEGSTKDQRRKSEGRFQQESRFCPIGTPHMWRCASSIVQTVSRYLIMELRQMCRGVAKPSLRIRRKMSTLPAWII